MASATMVSTMEIKPSASQWASKIRSQTLMLAPYNDTDELPESVSLDEDIIQAPRRRAANPASRALAQSIASFLYPHITNDDNDALGALIKYEKDIVQLRKHILHQRRRAIERATQRNMTLAKRILKQGPWNPDLDPVALTGAPSLPMPVQIAEPKTLEPFFEHLRVGGTDEISSVRGSDKAAARIEERHYGISALEFERGVLYSDHRLDLCKQVVGPRNIEGLMESLRTNEFVTHFLLGNNIIGPYGAQCIAKFLDEYPNRMDTWYLAGNCIDSTGLRMLVDGWVNSKTVTNIWLKRNPLMGAAGDVFRLITQTPNLRTLDLDQTELGDVGVAELFTKLAEYSGDIPLRHIYLNGIGIGENAAAKIAAFLASPHCALESLYASSNPMGSAGIRALAAGLKKNATLTRLTLSSTGMTDSGAVALCEALIEHPGMKALDIGQSFATADLGARYNWISDESRSILQNLISTSGNLRYLNLGYCAFTPAGLDEILRAVIGSASLLFYNGFSIHRQTTPTEHVHIHTSLSKEAQKQLSGNVKRVYGSNMTYVAFLEDEKRWLLNDKTDVRKIDSVYRNRDTQLARRGLKVLDKLWNEGDETLKGVMGAVGPACVFKKRLVEG